jgi:predicted DNA-binding transcriptional regulator AlpA
MTADSNQYQLLTIEEAAKIARCTTRFLENSRRRGEGPPIVRLGVRSIRYEKAAFVAWLQAKVAGAEHTGGAVMDSAAAAPSNPQA